MKYQRYDFTISDVDKYLCAVFDANDRFYPRILHGKHMVVYDMEAFSDDGRTVVDSSHPPGSLLASPIGVYIGTKTMEEEASLDGRVRNRDFVGILFQGFHESAHLWQHTVGYRKQPEHSGNVVKDMARMRAVRVGFPPFRKDGYRRDVTEVFANYYACSKITDFVDNCAKIDSRFRYLDFDDYACTYCASLYGMDFNAIRGCKTAEDASHVLSDIMMVVPELKRFGIPSSKYPTDEAVRSHLVDVLKSERLADQVLSAEDGREETAILCEYLGHHQPSCFRGLPCIRQDYVVNNIKGVAEKVVGGLVGSKNSPCVDLSCEKDSDEFGL